MSVSNTSGPVLWSLDERGVATVTLNRPEVNNAYNGDLIQGVLNALDALGAAPSAHLRLRNDGRLAEVIRG
jgi:methylglutaconyl-CoA hydratase